MSSIEKIHPNIKKYMFNIEQLPIYNYKDIPSTLSYISNSQLDNPNCHLGQRKLLLSEFEFYNKCVKNNNNLIIYAGSASCEHLPVILNLFPTLKFILIDPNYHSINAYYEYIYQNVDKISNENFKLFKQQLQKNDNMRHKHLYHTTTKLLKTNFINNTTHNVLNKDNKHKKVMNQLMNDFYTNKIDIIDYIMKGQKRVFIIQDYMTIELTKKLKEYINNKTLDLYFITDIRTNMFGEDPTDIDIIWNSALQIIFLKLLLPKYSMLKFRPPFFIDYDNTVKYFQGDKTFIINDIKYALELCNTNLITEYINHNFFYFNNDFIYTQAWSPKGSSESRIIISLENINNPFVIYDNFEWENKFYYFKLIRMYKFYPLFYEKIKNISSLHYDGCQDCARELMIILEYISKTNKNFDYDLPKLALELDKPQTIKELIYIYNLINEYTFFNLQKNSKCIHGYLIEYKKSIEYKTKDDKIIVKS
jgi:hypothetical protein